LGHISVGKIALSFHHLIKASQPIFVVFLSRLTLNESYHISTYLSLIPIIIGVCLASLTEFHFDQIGFYTGFLSTIISVCQTIYSKFLFTSVLLDFWNVQFYISTLSAILLGPFCIVYESLPIWLNLDSELNNAHFDGVHATILLLISVFTYYIHNVLAFQLVSKVATLTYAIAGVTKRILLIVGSVIYFANPVSGLNALGIALAILGVGLYHYTKFESKHHKHSLPSSNDNRDSPTS